MTRVPLKIAVVRPYLTTKKGGAERYALDLIHNLAQAGHHVHAFANRWDVAPPTGTVFARVAMPRKPAWLRVLLFHFNLRRRLRFADYDAVLGLTPFWPQQVFWLGDGLYRVWVRIAWPRALVRAVMCLIRAVMTVNLGLERKILTDPSVRYIANSKLVARQARLLYGVPGDNIAVVYPWIDHERFNLAKRALWRAETRRHLGVGEERTVVLFAANNFKRKGLDLLLGALAQMKANGAPPRLIVAGAGAIAAYRRKALRLGVAEHTTFVGAVADLERYCAAADIFALPTRYDPCATVCLEAMACGVPVITTALNGAAELIEEGRSGFTLSADASAADWAETIGKLAGDQRCVNAGARAHERVRGLSTAEHLRRVIAALDAARRPPAAVVPVRLGPGLWANKFFLPLLEQRGLSSFSALLEDPKRIEIEYNLNKRISLLPLGDSELAPAGFLKYHRRRRSWAGRFLELIGRASSTEGIKEWRNILRFQSAGLPTAVPLAAGSRRGSDGSRESFVMTLRLDDYLPLDRYIAAHFAPPLSDSSQRHKRALIYTLADVARRMHGASFNHRDFYLCHVFAKSEKSGSPDLKIIDLQRVGYHRLMMGRWRAKDVAELYYSSLSLPLTARDRLRFFARYCGALSGRQRRRLLARILRKAAAIERHDARLRARQPHADLKDPFDVSMRLTRSQHEPDRRQ